MDSVTSIPFAGIGIVNKAIGTLSEDNGSFKLEHPKIMKGDSIHFSAIGYQTKTLAISELATNEGLKIQLEKLAQELEEITISSKILRTEILGSKKYTTNNCTGFVKGNNNWIGSETATLAGNKEGRRIMIQSFSFYVIQNKYSDSLQFRLMFYEASQKKWPRLKTFLRRAILFKVAPQNGKFTLDLSAYNLITTHDFFISIECLENEVDISKFCYSGAYSQPAFVRPAAYERWHKTKGGGAEMQVKVALLDE